MIPRPRRPLVGGNWKMHKSRAAAREFTDRLLARIEEVLLPQVDCGTGLIDTPEPPEWLTEPSVDVVVFPSHPLLPAVAEALRDSLVAWGGQDLHPEDSGAHTGDVSGPQLADAGCTWVLCGHSERRRDHRESSALVAAKAEAARRNGLRPLVCVGESLEERRGGRTEQVLEEQLRPLLELPVGSIDLAYEPVWAIGTGETATPDQAAAAHAFLRGGVADAWGRGRAEEIRILYGGSVKPENAAELLRPVDVDGFLVGGASLDPASFLGIIEVCGG